MKSHGKLFSELYCKFSAELVGFLLDVSMFLFLTKSGLLSTDAVESAILFRSLGGALFSAKLKENFKVQPYGPSYIVMHERRYSRMIQYGIPLC